MELKKPLFVFDADCRFCRMWVHYSSLVTGEKVSYAPLQEVEESFPEISRDEFKQSVKLIMPDGNVYSAAAATYRTLAFNPRRRRLLWLYEHVLGFSLISELGYRFVASHRTLAYYFSKLFIGSRIEPLSYLKVRRIFFRLLGITYFFAFFSIALQISGLIGSKGILPAATFFESIRIQVGAAAYWLLPSLLWLNTSDTALQIVVWSGVLISLLLIAGFLVRTSLAFLFVLYLSLVSVGQMFMSYQWDVFLLEVGFLAILFSFSTSVVWLLRFLLFKFTILSGIGKLASGDPTWKDLTALTYHYFTQPLPMPLAWFFHNLSEWFHAFSAIVMFGIQLVVPLLFFAPRRVRFLAATFVIALEILILLTGNYNFFNLLTIALALLLFDDKSITWIQRIFRLRTKQKEELDQLLPLWGKVLLGTISTFLIVMGAFQIIEKATGSAPRPVRAVSSFISPLHITNSYGLFTVMTTSRSEIIVEGSNDGEVWKEYTFKYKPGRLDRSLPIIAPLQPRLDWQMWFASLRGNYQGVPWFQNFALRLLEGSPVVLKLLETNPFPDKPPIFVRAILYDYTFTSPEERRATGNIWKRNPIGFFLPPASLNF